MGEPVTDVLISVVGLLAGYGLYSVVVDVWHLTHVVMAKPPAPPSIVVIPMPRRPVEQYHDEDTTARHRL
jgi:hypothetical protein